MNTEVKQMKMQYGLLVVLVLVIAGLILLSNAYRRDIRWYLTCMFPTSI